MSKVQDPSQKWCIIPGKVN